MSLRVAFLAPGVLEAFEACSERFEGDIPHMYRDYAGTSKDPAKHNPMGGYVTCGVGLLIDPVEMALALPWVRLSDGAPASAAEVREEWTRIKREPNLNRDGAGAARKLCALRLTPEGVRMATLAALERMLRSLVLDFADWEEWPGDAQLADQGPHHAGPVAAPLPPGVEVAHLPRARVAEAHQRLGGGGHLLFGGPIACRAGQVADQLRVEVGVAVDEAHAALRAAPGVR